MRWGALLLGLCLALGAASATAREGQMERPLFQQVGVIRHIDTAGRVIVIDDAQLHVAQGVEVHTPTLQHGSLYDLRPGMTAGCRFKKDGEGRAVVSEIWVLPEGAPRLPLPR